MLNLLTSGLVRLGRTANVSLEAIEATASAAKHAAETLDDVTLLGKDYVGGLRKEQAMMAELRLKDLTAKVEAKYSLEKATWSSLKRD